MLAYVVVAEFDVRGIGFVTGMDLHRRYLAHGCCEVLSGDPRARAARVSERTTEEVVDPCHGECPIVCVRGLGLQVVRESVGVCHG